MRVLVRPCYADFLKDRLFVPEHRYSSGWLQPYATLKARAGAEGIEIATWDRFPLETADVILFQDLPPTKAELVDVRRRAPRAKMVLQVLESPLGRPHAFVRENHERFDAVLTYDSRLVAADPSRFWRYRLPVGAPPSIGEVSDVPFGDRKPMVIINSNRSIGVLARRQTGLHGLPFIGPAFSGWKCPPLALATQNVGELYSRRREIASAASHVCPDAVDVWGEGWRGEPMSWLHRFLPNRAFAVGRGPFKGEKMQLLPRYRFCLSFENVIASIGYISEKIFDPMYAGVVPIYLGDRDIQKEVPAEAYVDARRFRTDRELLEYVLTCPEQEWARLRSAGRQFVTSERMSVWLPEAFAESVIRVLRAVGANQPTRERERPKVSREAQ